VSPCDLAAGLAPVVNQCLQDRDIEVVEIDLGGRQPDWWRASCQKQPPTVGRDRRLRGQIDAHFGDPTDRRKIVVGELA
jgi:hypothetical protein